MHDAPAVPWRAWVCCALLCGVTFPIIASPAYASAPTFDEPYSLGEFYNNPGDCVDVVSGDVTGDGHADVLVATREPDGVQVWRGNGRGRLVLDHTLAIHPGTLVLTDANADHVLDLAVGREESVELFHGLGNGNFGSGDIIPLGDYQWTFRVVDMNRDGYADVVAAVGWSALSVVFQHADGTWATPTLYPCREFSMGLDVADFNRDGVADVVVASFSTPALMVFTNKGDGSLDSTTFDVGPSGDSRVVAGDFNGDGAPDIAIVGSDTSRVVWNDGTGSMDAAETLETGGIYWPPLAIASDLDHDRRTDLVVGRLDGTYYRPSGLNVYWELAPDSPRVTTQLVAQPGAHGARGTAADLDEDGLEDLIVLAVDGGYFAGGWSSSGELWVVRHQSGRRFIGLELAVAGTSRLAGAHVVRDGSRLGVMVRRDAPDSIMYARSDGSLEPSVAFPVGDGAIIVDIDRDGCDDVAFNQNGVLQIQYCGGAVADIPMPPSELILGLADFDGDGADDLLLGPPGGASIAYRTGNGFASPATLLLPWLDASEVTDLLAVDFNRDGRADLAAVSGDYDAALSLSINASNGAFSAGPSTAIDWSYYRSSPPSLIACNLDGNQDVDVLAWVSQSSGAGLAYAFFNTGAGGVFQSGLPPYYLVSEAPYLSTADVNGDGLSDLLNYSFGEGSFGSRLSLRVNRGGGAFDTYGREWFIPMFNSSISRGDLNGDGMTDLVLGTTGGYGYPPGPSVTVLLNTTPSLPVPTAPAFVRATLEHGRAVIVWHSASRLGARALITRSADRGAWEDVGSLDPDASGLVRFEDGSVRPGHRYRCRLGTRVADALRYVESTELAIPGDALTLAQNGPNPARGALRFTYSLARVEPATIELIDIAGRRVRSWSIAPGLAAHAGFDSAGLHAGIYWARLTQGAESAVIKVVLAD